MPMDLQRKAKAITSYKHVMSRRPALAPAPTQTYGLILTYECLTRFGLIMHDHVNPQFDHMNESHCEVMIDITTQKLPLVCMIVIDSLFLFHWKTHLVNTKNGLQYLLVLANNGLEELETAITKTFPEALDMLVQFLNMGDVQPAWQKGPHHRGWTVLSSQFLEDPSGLTLQQHQELLEQIDLETATKEGVREQRREGEEWYTWGGVSVLQARLVMNENGLFVAGGVGEVMRPVDEAAVLTFTSEMLGDLEVAMAGGIEELAAGDRMPLYDVVLGSKLSSTHPSSEQIHDMTPFTRRQPGTLFQEQTSTLHFNILHVFIPKVLTFQQPSVILLMLAFGDEFLDKGNMTWQGQQRQQRLPLSVKAQCLGTEVECLSAQASRNQRTCLTSNEMKDREGAIVSTGKLESQDVSGLNEAEEMASDLPVHCNASTACPPNTFSHERALGNSCSLANTHQRRAITIAMGAISYAQ
ncbi:hypothetical protein BDN71DRAFT_1428212 [Pleurotus eryngii]|uniref:Uncharacterized protein n=1 Tax=Pleurotus eryngii TaxID=5323 RepID=A0A9P6DID0_PLEER|nr:hypothetical protein BDN71DRAFT_1428212 [Pleurotus eryngii]